MENGGGLGLLDGQTLLPRRKQWPLSRVQGEVTGRGRWIFRSGAVLAKANLEAHLVVALTSAARGLPVSAGELSGSSSHMLDDQRPRQCRDQRVLLPCRGHWP